MNDDKKKISAAEMMKRSIYALNRANEKISALKEKYEGPIAIIGMACRFPGDSNTPDAFWNLLSAGVDGIKDIPAERFNIDSYYDPEPGKPGKIITRKGAFIQNIDRFDADFFGISPIEAESMDPQQRLLLHVSWEALENAAIPPDSLRESATGVFVGVSNNDYGDLLSQRDAAISSHTASGNALNALSGRLSYCLGLQGPSMIIDTACSSSLVSLHIACKSLQQGDCNLSIAAGVNIIIAPENYIALSMGQMLSPEGHCKTFDASADGYARGEGIGVLILKRLSDAERDRDTIFAVIKGSAVNQDGPSSGLTVPNGAAQVKLIRQALKQANIKPSDISYVEAHGTGTSLGDPIEVNAIAKVYGESREKEIPLLIGSIKSNIGHLESAAGVSSLMKVILALNHKAIPGNLHFHHLNPKIDLASIPAKIVTELTPWPTQEGQKRMAGVSGFGFTGTNAHIILEEAPALKPMEMKREERPLHLFTLSARSKEALNELIKQYQVYLNTSKESLADIVYTVTTGRNHDAFRLAVVAKDVEELRSKLDAGQYAEGEIDQNKRFQINFHFSETGSHSIPEIKNNVMDIDLGPSSNWQELLNALSNYYIAGANINWKEFESSFERKKVLLPTYPFHYQRYWSELITQRKQGLEVSVNGHPFLARRLNSPGMKDIIYESTIDFDWPEFVSHHLIYDYPVIAGAGYISALLSVIKELSENSSGIISDLNWIRPLVFSKGEVVTLQIILHPQDESHYEFEVVSRKKDEEEALDSEWLTHASGQVQLNTPQEKLPEDESIEAIQSRLKTHYEGAFLYGEVTPKISLDLGPHFRWIEAVDVSENEILAKMRFPESGSESDNYLLYPGFIDSVFQAGFAFMLLSGNIDILSIPLFIEKISYDSRSGYPRWIHAKKRREVNEELTDFILFNERGKVIGVFQGFRTRAVPKEALLRAHGDVTSLFYEWVWSESALEEVSTPDALGHWLVLRDGPVSDELVTLFENKGASLRRISAADHPKNKEAFVELLKSEDFSGILHVASTADSSLLTSETIKQAQILGAESLLHLSQALVELGASFRIPLFLITKNLSAENVFQSPINGFYKTLLLEYPEILIKQIDLRSDWNSDLVFQSLFSKNNESIIAVGKDRFFVPRFSKTKNTHRIEDEINLATKIRKDATYLITGGLGGLGLALAKFLAEKGVKNLVLTGRRALDDEIQSTLKNLDILNTKITYESLDIGDEKSVENLLIRLENSKKPLKGIFHLAGVLEDATLMEQDWGHFEKVFRPKVYGSFYLHQYSKNLDLFVMFSSIASSLGSPGQINYASANAFMDALCEYRQKQGLPAHSLSWGPWAEVGMAKDLVTRHAKSGMIGLKTKEGMRALEIALFSDKAHITVANIHWKNYLKQMIEAPSWLEAFAAIKISKENLLLQLEALPVNERIGFVKNTITNIVHSVLGISASQSIDEKKGFFDMGLDSLMAVQLKNNLQAELGKSAILASTVVFDHPSIEKMALHISTLLKLEGIKVRKPETALPPVSSTESIAIIGLGCRFPAGGNSPEEFWNFLESGKDGISEVPKERFDVDAYYDPEFDVPGKMYTRKGGFLNIAVDLFDNDFFGISPREAEFMDPQQRLLLEVVCEALEDAMIPSQTLEGTSTGVFVGFMTADYSDLIKLSSGLEGISPYLGPGNSNSASVGRISYYLGLQGPCLAIETACSSSLVAINSACESLRLGQCQQAIVGGVNLILGPSTYILECQMHMLSPDGHSKSFDKAADGYARAEGCGVVILKPLSQAKRDGDKIYAVIKGSGVNQNGSSSGLTVPNGEAQASLMNQVLKQAGLRADEIDYIEAHGTGTSLGDPIEVRAIGETYGRRDMNNPLFLGTVKSNFGHAEGAAGIAGLIKTVLSLKHQMLPPNLNFKELNPHIELNFPVRILTEKTPWPKSDRIRRAGVSSFGFSGINAHVILEEPPEIERKEVQIKERPIHILTLSAKSDQALEALLQHYIQFLEETEYPIADVCYSANTGRNHERFRVAVIAKTIEELQAKIKKNDFLRSEAKEFKVYDIPDPRFIDEWESELKKIAIAYVQGANIDWKLFDKSYARQIINLPTYPFQRKSYWAPMLRAGKKLLDGPEIVHPLLGIKRELGSGEILFEQIANFEKFQYLRSHVIYDSVILPGAGFVELIEAALFNLVKGPCQLKDLSIEKPLMLRPEVDTRLQVIAKLNENVWSFSVYSNIDPIDENPWILHAQAAGELLLENEELILSPRRLNRIAGDIKGQDSKPNYYEAFSQLGYHYGPEFQGLIGITKDEEEDWGYVVSPDSLDLEKYLFHPALLDITFHALMAKKLEEFRGSPFLPISFESVSFYRPFGSEMWVKIIPEPSCSEEISTASCSFYNALGECCAKITKFTSKKSTREAFQKLLNQESINTGWMYHIVWVPKQLPLATVGNSKKTWLVLSTVDLLISEEIMKIDLVKPVDFKVIEAVKSGKYFGILIFIDDVEKATVEVPDLEKNGVFFLLSIAKVLLAYPEYSVFIINIHNAFSSALYASFCRTWRLEEPNRIIKYIEFEDNRTEAIDFLQKEIASDNPDNEIRYQGSERRVSRLEHLNAKLKEGSKLSFNSEGFYIITGGLGGLGLSLAKFCVQRGVKNLILCGRSKPTEEAAQVIRLMQSEGANIIHKSIDISNPREVNHLIQSTVPLKGIFHLAGTAEQGFISSQTPTSFQKAFAAKAQGAFYLHQATQNLDLDYFVLFSSVASAMGSPGAVNYAVSNAFLDALAEYRCSRGLRAHSVQWGPWGEVGMMKQLSEAQQIPGLIKMPPSKALNAFQDLLLTKTEGEALIANINWAEIPKRMPTQPLWESFIPKEKAVTGFLINRLLSQDPDDRLNYLKIFLRDVLKNIFKLHEISPEMYSRGFFDFGMDSLMSVDFYKQLSEAVGNEHKLAYTLAYDYPNINALADYLMTALALKEKPKLRVSARIQGGDLDQVAVIGMACRFPGGANSPEEYWDVLKKEKSINKIIPAERWDADLYYDPDREKVGKMYAKSAHFLNFPIDRFDSEFFNISPREAEFMDPQQRLLMEISWELFENAGIDPQKLRGSQTGVFIGLMTQDYHSLLGRAGGLGAINKFTGVGTDYLGGPGRLSFYYGFRGPSAPVLTACSSSLVATHLGLLSLQRGESDLVLAGGVNLILDPFYMIALCKMGLLSPDGLSKTFDKTANGYGRGEGCGLVLLKRLKDAERDHDNILAVIRGTAMNHNGPSSGLTVPSSLAQQELYLSALNAAKISPENISFIESHGTGTALGDPIEVGSIKEIYGNPGRKNPLWLGAVKSNIGHLEGAAGVSSLIKAILCLQHKEIPPQNHFQNLNPGIDLASIPAKLPTEVVKWEGINGQFVAAVSSFGATGVNAHAIIELPQEKLGNEVPGLKFPLHILTFSAHTQEALDELLEQYPHYLAETAESLENIAYSMNMGRSQFKYRIAILAKDKAELSEKLKRKDWIKSLEAISSEIHLDFEFTDKENFTLIEDQRTQHKIIIGQECEWSLFLSKIAEYFVQGADINWQNFYSQSRFKKIILPHYPFQRQRYWAPVLEEARSEKENIESLLSHDKDLIPIKTVATLVRKSPKENQLELVHNYLAIVLNKVSGLPLGGLQTSTQLQNLGFDSLMLGELRARFQDDLSISLDITEIQNKKDIQELSDLIVTQLVKEKLETPKEHYDTRVSRVLQVAKNKKYQLFLIPPMGFGQASYLNWVGKISDNFEIIYLGYQFNNSWEDMILTMLKTMKSIIDRPFIIYGHSLGGILAYEIALQLEGHTNFRPEALMISSVAAPEQFARLKFTFPFNQIVKGANIDNIDLLMKAHFLPPEGSLMKIVSPEEINADATAIINYSNKLSTSLTIPLIAIQANNDVLVRDPNLIASWKEYTKNYFSYFEIEGTHLFFTNPPESIFDSIRKIFEKSSQTQNLRPGVYQLKEYIQGSNRNISYPLGLQPEGFILYDDSTQAMAAHLWSPHSRELLKSLGENDEVKMIEFMLSHIAYCGRFTSHSGVVNHQVEHASFPNYSDDILSLNYHSDLKNLTLSTFPKTQKKKIPEQFQTLYWESIIQGIENSPLVGCWELEDYQENDQPVLGENPVGKMLITNSNYFSMHMAAKDRKPFHDNNPALATNDELISAYRTYRSLFGEYQMPSDDRLIKCKILSPVPFNDAFSIHFLLENNELQLEWEVSFDPSITLRTKSRWRRA